jgi:hypothetical protein
MSTLLKACQSSGCTISAGNAASCLNAK